MRPTSYFCTGAAGRIGVVLALVATLVVTSLAPPAAADTGGIVSIVGGEHVPFAGDGGPATAAVLNDPSRIAVDAAGNIFIADTSNNRVRRVEAASGVITTVAGTGAAGFSGDGGPATEAQLNGPGGLALDAAGNLFIADLSNSRVRRVDGASGVIATVAGRGASGFSGDGGAATEAQLSTPSGLTLDGAGRLFIADTANNRIRVVSPSGIIDTYAGRDAFAVPYSAFSGDGGPATEATMNSPGGVAVDAAGNLFIADRDNHRIRRVDTAGIITTVAGGERVDGSVRGFSGDGGAATSAQLFEPIDVAVDAAGNLLIADLANHRIRRVDTTGTITTVAGPDEALESDPAGSSGDGGPATDARLNRPAGVAAGNAAGTFYIADQHNHRVRHVVDGTISTAAGIDHGGGGDGGPATEAQIDNPRGMAVDAAGNLYFADLSNRRVRKVDAAGVITTVAGTGSFGSSGDGGPATDADLKTPLDVALDAVGNLYIADRNDHRIRKVDAAGVITTVAGTGTAGFSGDGGPAVNAALDQPTGVALDDAGNLYIADRNNHRIRKVDAAGVITTVAGTGAAGFSGDGGQAGAAQLNSPADVVVDADGGVVIADTGNNRVRRVDSSGIITTVAGDGTLGLADGPGATARFSFPMGVATGPRGSIYVADQGNHAVRRIDAAGFVATVAGTGDQGFSGDGGAAAAAQLSFPSAVVVAPGAQVLVADSGNHRIRAISPLRADLMAACPPGATAPSGFVDIGSNAHVAAIECVAWYGIALGGPSGLAEDAYGPDLDVRRDQMASFIARLIDHVGTDLLPPGDGANAFDCDVDPSNPHYANIQRLAAAGVVLGGPNGLADNCFGPAQTVRRDQMASFINRAVEKVTGAVLASDGDVFGDDDASVHQANINGVASEGIVLGTAAGVYGPDGHVGRDQMASFVARTADYLVDQGFTEPPG